MKPLCVLVALYEEEEGSGVQLSGRALAKNVQASRFSS